MNQTPEIEYLAKNIKERYLDKENDYIIIVTGKEGSGKSNFSFNLASEIDPDFNLENIVFKPKDMREVGDKLPKKSALIVDEGTNVFNKYESMTKQTRKTVKKLTMMRFYQLVIFINISNLGELHKYFKVHRLDQDGICIVRITHRGNFWFVGNSGVKYVRKKLLQKNKTFSWSDKKLKDWITRGSFKNYEKHHSQFSKKYREKKLKQIAEPESEEEKKTELTKGELIQEIIKTNPNVKNKEIEKAVNTSSGYVSDVRKKL